MAGVPIRKVIVRNIPKDVSIEDIRAEFGRFGFVEHVSIECNNGTEEKFAFVTFYDADAVRSIVRLKSVSLKGSPIIIQEADNTDQPDYVTPLVHDPTVEQDSKNTILKLDDDCLLEIFSYINWIELQRLAGVCWRFKKICENIYSRCKSLNMRSYRDTSFTDLHLLLQRVGPHLHSLVASSAHFVGNDEERMRLYGNYCTNLRALTLLYWDFEYIWINMSSMLTNVQRLELVSCALTDESLSALLRGLTVLQELNLTRNGQLSGSSLKDVCGLTSINMSFCKRLKPDYFLPFLANNRELRELNIIGCTSLNKECIKTIARLLHQLERLDLSDTYIYMNLDKDLLPLTEMRSLRHLKVDSSRRYNANTFLSKLSKNVTLHHLEISSPYRISCLFQFKELRSLKINYTLCLGNNPLPEIVTLKHLEKLEMPNSDLSNNDVLDIIVECIQLREFKVCGCYQLTIDLLKDVVAAIENRAHVLTLYVYGTRIKKIGITNMKLGKRLKVDFTPNRPAFPVYKDDYYGYDDHHDGSSSDSDDSFQGRTWA